MAYARIESTEQLARLVKATRKEQKITAEDVAKFGDISRYTILNFENKKSDIRLKTLLKILSLCGLELHIKIKSQK